MRLVLKCGAEAWYSSVLLGAVGQFTRFLMSAEVVHIEIEGMDRASEVSIRHLADLREGDRLLGLDLERVVNSVKRHPWVAEAQIKRKFPSTVRIQVQEHQPVLLLAHRGLFFVADDAFTPRNEVPPTLP